MLLSWVLFPGVLAALSLGCGLLVERGAGRRLPGALLLPLGFAAIVVLAEATTFFDATAELTTPLVVLVAILGIALTGRRRPKIKRPEINWWYLLAALAAFAVYAAPVVLSGEATLAGYQKLDDTANWLAVTDQLLEHGRSLDTVNPSTYREALSLYVGTDNWYPVGSYPPLGVASRLLAVDPAWTIQPYMAYLAAMLALTLTFIARSVLDSWRRAAVAGLIAAQPALLVAYSLWGGVKEMVGAAMLALVAVFAARALRDEATPRDLLPLAVCAAALFFALSFGGGAWLAALPILAIVLLLREGRKLRALVRPVAITAAVAACAVLPFVLTGKIGPGDFSALTNPSDPLGNLANPLEGWRVMGIWPVGDFRFAAELPVPTAVAIATAILAALGGLLWSWKRRAWLLLFYFTTAAVGGLVVFAVADAWIGGKALAMSAPGFLLAAMVGLLALAGRGGRTRILAYPALALVIGGVLLSNALAYHETTLAPRAQLAELEQIGERIAGQGPTLVTEYQPYAGRYFLRDGDPEVASDLRTRLVPLVNGGALSKSLFADTDELNLAGIQEYRTLVLRTSPAQSRPPAEYQLIWAGDYYEVWQRPEVPALNVTHLPLGQTLAYGPGASTDRVAVPDCDQVLALAEAAGPGARLTAAPGQQPIPILFADADFPANWSYSDEENYLGPDTGGSLTAVVNVDGSGVYDLWLGGSMRGRMTSSVDGEEIGSVAHRINNLGQYIDLGSVSLSPGLHSIELDYSLPLLRPGTGGVPYTLGPLLLGTSAGDGAPLVTVAASEARSLCGQSWDWIEAQG